ncbi:hypothetical protein FOCC_FOCC009605 [Frankliniella occidentalis]|nr:hypothetical protein FOCC_FOCC009605 [Frankliniella occidentalis]
MISLISTLILEVATMRDPQDALRDDFDYNNYDVESGYEELELTTTLAAYLWVVAWSLYLDCNEEARRSASSPVCMSALVEDGEEDVDQCSVPYATLGKPN